MFNFGMICNAIHTSQGKAALQFVFNIVGPDWGLPQKKKKKGISLPSSGCSEIYKIMTFFFLRIVRNNRSAFEIFCLFHIIHTIYNLNLFFFFLFINSTHYTVRGKHIKTLLFLVFSVHISTSNFHTSFEFVFVV